MFSGYVLFLFGNMSQKLKTLSNNGIIIRQYVSVKETKQLQDPEILRDPGLSKMET